MRRLIAATLVLLLAAGGVLGTRTPAEAGTATDIALGLASFAVFNQVVAPLLRPRPAEAAYHRRAVVYRTVVTHPPVVYAAPAPPPAPTVIHYPHGRYVLQLHGPQYVWVWYPNVPPPPPPPPPALH
jgi:hypothetical protein